MTNEYTIETIRDLIDLIDNTSIIREMLENDPNVDYVDAEECDLDPRSGKLWIAWDDDYIISSRHGLNYYGGFEYVDDDHKFTIGDYTFYSGWDSERVKEAIDAAREKKIAREDEELEYEAD